MKRIDREGISQVATIDGTRLGVHARLSFGRGTIGADSLVPPTPEAESAFAEALSRNTAQVRPEHLKQADCVDFRAIVSIADGTINPRLLSRRVRRQAAGGLGFALTHALVTADAAIVRDAKNFKDAREKVHKIMTARGWEDGGHGGCKANLLLQATVAQALPPSAIFEPINLLRFDEQHEMSILESNHATRRNRLLDGFYDDWDPSWQDDFLTSRAPQNFLTLEDPSELPQGVGPGGVYLLPEGYGLKRNRMAAESGYRAFAASTDLNHEVTIFGFGETEKARIQTAMAELPLQVLNMIATPDMPVVL